ncbi:MAG: hypothetical protein EP329_26295 [Deltaproteobacteria bacterium]|nr:MAG: hypothetical protein EP329_26295 [Deltaproteobacteria bacterium]
MLLVLVGSPAHCLWPPSYEVAPEVNEPVTIDRDLLSISPSDFHVWGGCPDVFSLDISSALSNPDDDELTIAWVVNYEEGLKQKVDDFDTTEFVFNPCENVRTIVGGVTPNIIRVWVLDRAPLSHNNADDFRTIVDPDTTMAEVTWFFYVEDDTCCLPTQ